MCNPQSARGPPVRECANIHGLPRPACVIAASLPSFNCAAPNPPQKQSPKLSRGKLGAMRRA
eukprot:11418413-Alexandrium_andersonii.AAC.1